MLKIFRFPMIHTLKKISSLSGGSRAMTISVRKREENRGSTSEQLVVGQNPEPVVAFSRPPSIPPLIGTLVLLTLLETDSDDE